MSTEEQVRKAAARYRRWKSGDFPNAYKSPYFNCDGDDPAYIDRDRRTLADAYIDELSRRESERAERAKPIDAEWLNATNALKDGHWWIFDVGIQVGLSYINDAWAVTVNHRFLDAAFSTRGQLLDLLAAMKGGE